MNRRRLILTSPLMFAAFPPVGARGQMPSPRGIPPAVIDKLLRLIGAAGVDTALPAPVAAALELASDGQPWPDRQFAVKSTEEGTLHAVATHRGADPDMVFSIRGPAAISIFRVRRDGTLAGATAFFSDTHLTASLPPAQSRADFVAEGAFWALHVDGLSSQLP